MLGGLAVTAGILGSGFTGLGAVISGVTTLLGAGSAAGTLVIAKAGNQSQLEGGDGLAQAGLTRDEARKLLGIND